MLLSAHNPVADVSGLPTLRKLDIIRRSIRRYSRNPEIRQLASSIVASPSKGLGGDITAIFNWVRWNVNYEKDIRGRDIFESPLYTLKVGKGDCDAFTILIGSMYRSLGYPIRIRIASRDGKEWTHIYPLVGYPKDRPSRWVVVDASAPYPMGWENPELAYRRDFSV